MFEQPEMLLLLLLAPMMLVVFYWRDQQRQQALNRLGDAELVGQLVAQVSVTRRRWKSALWLIALVGVIIAMARPIWGVDAEIIETQGLSVVFVLDVSASMDAEDVLPSRLEKAKLAIQDIMQSAEGNLFGLVLFAGDAFVQFPLTSDVNTAKTFVDAASSRSISRQGTVIEDALVLGLSVLDERLADDGVIILMTDGENHDGDPLAIAEQAQERGITVHVVGYGTPEGDVVPIRDDAGNIIDYKSDAGRNLVISQLNEPILEAIAGFTGGIYQRAEDSGIEVVNLVNDLNMRQGNLIDNRLETRNVPRFEIFIGIALLALSIEIFLSERYQVEV